MNRRQFFMSGTATFAASRMSWAPEMLGSKPKRVGLIGSGWYGKADLLRLIQVAPVEVVSLCDVDKQMLADAAEIVSQRQASRKKPAPMATTGRCCARRISTSCWWRRRTIGTPSR